MANTSKADLILHPARLKIILALADGPMSTQELAAILPDLPSPSLYRHLKTLLKGGLVQVAETHHIRGTEEKVYQLAQSPHLKPDDVNGMTKDEHLQYFTQFVLTLIKDYEGYLQSSPDPVDMAADFTGFSEGIFATNEEDLRLFFQKIQEAVKILQSTPPEKRRFRYKIAFLNHLVSRDVVNVSDKDE